MEKKQFLDYLFISVSFVFLFGIMFYAGYVVKDKVSLAPKTEEIDLLQGKIGCPAGTCSPDKKYACVCDTIYNCYWDFCGSGAGGTRCMDRCDSGQECGNSILLQGACCLDECVTQQGD